MEICWVLGFLALLQVQEGLGFVGIGQEGIEGHYLGLFAGLDACGGWPCGPSVYRRSTGVVV